MKSNIYLTYFLIVNYLYFEIIHIEIEIERISVCIVFCKLNIVFYINETWNVITKLLSHLIKEQPNCREPFRGLVEILPTIVRIEFSPLWLINVSNGQ